MEAGERENWGEEEREEEEVEEIEERDEGAKEEEEVGGAKREENPESGTGKRREVGERAEEAPKVPPSETCNWSEPKLRDWED